MAEGEQGHAPGVCHVGLEGTAEEVGQLPGSAEKAGKIAFQVRSVDFQGRGNFRRCSDVAGELQDLPEGLGGAQVVQEKEGLEEGPPRGGSLGSSEGSEGGPELSAVEGAGVFGGGLEEAPCMEQEDQGAFQDRGRTGLPVQALQGQVLAERADPILQEGTAFLWGHLWVLLLWGHPGELLPLGGNPWVVLLLPGHLWVVLFWGHFWVLLLIRRHLWVLLF